MRSPTARARTILVAAMLALAIGTGLAACGKKGDLEPPEDQKSTYPRQYPTR